MQEHFHFTTNQANIQKQYEAILSFVSTQLSLMDSYLQRHNRHLMKPKDEVIIAIHILGKLFGFTSERAWHRFVIGNLFSVDDFPKRSRYNRRARALRFAIKWIRQQVAKRGQHHAYAVIDSLPLEWCHAARVYRVKRFQGMANIGYCASKKQRYYGFKFHLQVTNQGLPMGYVVTEAPCHDKAVAETVMTQVPHPYTLGDKGYISDVLQKKAIQGISNGTVDAYSEESEEAQIKTMGTVDQAKAQSRRNRVFCSRWSVPHNRDSR